MARVIQDYSPKTQPLLHQIEAIRYLAETRNVALFDEQGLGKSKIVIDALCLAMEKREIDAALVVAPLSLVYVWEQEVLKHSHLVPIVLRGSEREKRYKFLTGANFYITNYEAVVAETERMRRFCRSGRVAVVLDEATHIKNPSTRTAKALFAIAPLATRRIIVTGTPVANKPPDLWAQFFFLDGGELLGSDFEAFCADFDERKPDYLAQLSQLRAVLASNSIRRTKADTLELPDKIYHSIAVELTGRQYELYNELREELRVEITGLDGAKVIDQAENILKRLLRLTQIASNPLLIDRSYDETPAKFTVLSALIEQIVSTGEKAIIWSSFVENILALSNWLRQYYPLVIHGGIPVPDRIRVVAQFQEDSRHHILIANPAAAREGLTLTRANNAIYLDRNFNLVDYLQSQDRIHRISQTKRCMIYKLIAKGTIDEYIDRILDLKTDVAGFVQGDASTVARESLVMLLSRGELLDMLRG